MSLTVEEVAEQVQIHPDTVRAEIRRGHLEAWKAGNSLRIEPEDCLQHERRVNCGIDGRMRAHEQELETLVGPAIGIRCLSKLARHEF